MARSENNLKRKIEDDCLIIILLLGVVQKEKPWIAITVKTKQAISTILHAMNEAIEHLKISGWLDDFECNKMLISLRELSNKVSMIQSVTPSAPRVIFKEVALMAGDKEVIKSPL
ncbi:hypothetical protein MTP99_002311 [Tenebrio molitor]|nr:hypothetical protein MTP99_002311 [Tenebrio molitor]